PSRARRVRRVSTRNDIDPLVALPARTVLIDGSPQTWRGYWLELCAFREMARILVRRDLLVHFRQTYVGFAWLLFKPLHGQNPLRTARELG
ncbi:MAG TPA: hypothetical protein PLS93_12205, partial [Accumulibacter sp.]|nr:hypothetical protein [Accumulibacter sp.]